VPEGDDEHPAVHGAAHADVANPTGAFAEIGRLGLVPAEELHEEGTGHVEALGHRVVHRRVDVHALPGDVLESGPDASGGEHEDGQDHDGEQGEAPLEQQHRDQRAAEGDDVADDGAERAGEGPLGADHVVVESADEGAGLGAGEERERHALDMVEEPHA